MNTRNSYLPYIALALFAGWMALEFWPRPKPPVAAYVTTIAHDTWEDFAASATNAVQAAQNPVTWLDHEPAMTIGKGDPAAQRIQLGLRSDGVVVWRRGYEPLAPAP